MLQCLDPESRCIFILGTMFRVDSRIAGDILGITPEAYRQRLSRVRKKMADFLSEYCGEYGKGTCRCANRLLYASATVEKAGPFRKSRIIFFNRSVDWYVRQNENCWEYPSISSMAAVTSTAVSLGLAAVKSRRSGFPARM